MLMINKESLVPPPALGQEGNANPVKTLAVNFSKWFHFEAV